MKTRENIYFALIVGATIVTLLGSAGKAIAFHPSGHTYQVLVTSSFGTQFTDCFRYNTGGILIIDGLGGSGVYDHDNRGTNVTKTQGINTGGTVELATHAQHKSRFKKIKGDAISRAGDTFTFDGFENPGCVRSPIILGPEANLGLEANPYENP
jgi:hypothetical protein